MRSRIAHTIAVVALLATGLVISLVEPVGAHEGHDHGAPPAAITTPMAPRADAQSEQFELVAVVRGGTLTVYLDRFATNQPVTGASLDIDTPSGPIKPLETAPGVYAAAVQLRPGSHDLAITITADVSVDLLTTTLLVPEPTPGGLDLPWTSPANAAGHSTASAAQSSANGIGLALLWIVFGFAGGLGVAALLRRRRHMLSLGLLLALLLIEPLPAAADGAHAAPNTASIVRDLAQRAADGTLAVPKATQRILAIETVVTTEATHRRALELPGRIIPDPNASGLVQASSGGRLAPPPGGFKPLGTRIKTGDLLAYIHPPVSAADRTTQQQQARELEQQIDIVARKVDRMRALIKVIARSQLEDAETELQGLKARRANLDRANREPEFLLAPVDGVLASANAVAGQMAEPNAVIFHIVDPTKLWVEALSFEPQSTGSKAQGLFAGGRRIDLVFAGAGLADRNQSIPIQFAVTGEPSGLRAGQLLTVFAETTDDRTGIALPRQAILRSGNGQTVVYEHTAAERFAVRDVRVEPLDAERVLVTSGLEPGKRIVVQGAELLNQIR